MKEKRHIGMEIGVVDNLIKRKTIVQGIDPELDSVTRMHGIIIGYLSRHEDGVMQKEIEREFSIRRSTASRILKLMQKNGFITREYVEYDARLKKIYLTDKARQVHKQILEQIDAVEARLTQGISQEEMDTFLAVLEKMKSNLDCGE